MQKRIFLTAAQYEILKDWLVSKNLKATLTKIGASSQSMSCPQLEKRELGEKFRRVGVHYQWIQNDYTSCGACAINNLLQNEEQGPCSQNLTLDEVRDFLEGRWYNVVELNNMEEVKKELGSEKEIIGFLMREKRERTKKGEESELEKKDTTLHWTTLKTVLTKNKTDWVHLDSIREPTFVHTPKVVAWIENRSLEWPILMVLKPYDKVGADFHRKIPLSREGESTSMCSKIIVQTLPQETAIAGITKIWTQKDCTSCGACAINNLLQEEVKEACATPLGLGEVVKILENKHYLVTTLSNMLEVQYHIREKNIVGFLMQHKQHLKEGGFWLHWTAIKAIDNDWVHVDSCVSYPVVLSKPVLDWIQRQSLSVEWPILMVAENPTPAMTDVGSWGRTLESAAPPSEEGLQEGAPAENAEKNLNPPPAASPLTPAEAVEAEAPSREEVATKTRSIEPILAPEVRAPPHEEVVKKSNNIQSRRFPVAPNIKASKIPRNITTSSKCSERAHQEKCFLKIFQELEKSDQMQSMLEINKYFSDHGLTPKLYQGGVHEGKLVFLSEKYQMSVGELLSKTYSELEKLQEKYRFSSIKDFLADKLEKPPQFLFLRKNVFDTLNMIFGEIRKVAQKGWFLADMKPMNIVVNYGNVDLSAPSAVRVIDIETFFISAIYKYDFKDDNGTDEKLVTKFGKETVVYTYNVTMLYLLAKYIARYFKLNDWPHFWERFSRELQKFNLTLPEYTDLSDTRFFNILRRIYVHYHVKSKQPTNYRELSLPEFWARLQEKITKIDVGETPSYKGEYRLQINNPPQHDLPQELSPFTKHMVDLKLHQRRQNEAIDVRPLKK